MARMPRLAVAGLPHLVIQRGHDAAPAFRGDADRRAYLDALSELSRDGSVAIHSYVLREREVMLLVTPRSGESLGRFMQRLNRRYVHTFHARHGTQGALWAGRFQAAPVDPEHYLLRAILLIEQAPVRAGEAGAAKDWPWSSAGRHVGRDASSLVIDHPAYWQLGNTPFEREARHDIELQRMLPSEQVAELLAAARGGWPLGGPAFIASIAQGRERPVQRRPRGRPQRAPSATERE